MTPPTLILLWSDVHVRGVRIKTPPIEVVQNATTGRLTGLRLPRLREADLAPEYDDVGYGRSDAGDDSGKFRVAVASGVRGRPGR